MSTGNSGSGRLVALNSSTLAPINSAPLLDPKGGNNANVPNDGTASPLVGPDGDVYIGVNDNSFRGWMNHFSADLTRKPTGAFGWDVTPSIVPAAMVPSYHGTSAYLIFNKYNNYPFAGGDGNHMLAILDPNDTQVDTRVNNSGSIVMKEILTILSPTPDTVGRREWCINTAVVDPATNSVLVNNEDGKLYRWDLTTNTLSEAITLTPGLLQAYTPTLIGPDGTVYAINDATLFAVGVPRVAAAWDGTTAAWSDPSHWSSPAVPHNGTPVTTWYDVSIASGTVSLDTPIANHHLTLAGGTLTGPANLSLSTAVISGTFAVGGTTTVSSSLLLNAGTHTAGPITGNGALALAAGASLTSGPITTRSLLISGNLTRRADAGTSKVTALTLAGAPDAWTGLLDLNNNALNLQPQGAAAKTAAITALQNQIAYAKTSGALIGPGITSSTAILDPDHLTLALADNADLHLTTFRGQPLDDNALILTAALLGDANLDTKVDAFDLNLLAAHWQQQSNALWSAGDFTQDGKVDAFDLNLLAANWQFGATLSFFPLPIELLPSPPTTIPEPRSLLMLAPSLLLITRLRRPFP
jgi:hypothetical protein